MTPTPQFIARSFQNHKTYLEQLQQQILLSIPICLRLGSISASATVQDILARVEIIRLDLESDKYFASVEKKQKIQSTSTSN